MPPTGQLEQYINQARAFSRDLHDAAERCDGHLLSVPRTAALGIANTMGVLAERAACALAVLKAVEWASHVHGYDDEMFASCPSCEKEQTDGHAPDCQLAAALKKAEKPIEAISAPPGTFTNLPPLPTPEETKRQIVANVQAARADAEGSR